MDVIHTDMPCHNLNVAAQAHLAQDLARSFGHFTAQNLVSIFRDPHQVILDVVDRMGSFVIVWHVSLVPFLSGESYSQFRAKAIRLKAKVLDLASGNKSCKQ
jgi:hypothetical protein